MTSEYRVAIEARSTLDAIDMAKRRARDDGFRVRTVKTAKLDALGKYAVCLAVDKA